jgi:hypothetical protein
MPGKIKYSEFYLGTEVTSPRSYFQDQFNAINRNSGLLSRISDAVSRVINSTINLLDSDEGASEPCRCCGEWYAMLDMSLSISHEWWINEVSGIVMCRHRTLEAGANVKVVPLMCRNCLNENIRECNDCGGLYDKYFWGECKSCLCDPRFSPYEEGLNGQSVRVVTQSRCNACDRMIDNINQSDIDKATMEGQCWRCWSRRYINEWNYKPNSWKALMHRNDSGNTVLYGIENEVAVRRGPAAFVNSVYNEMPRRAFVKRDGSINTDEGIEVVTHPMSYKYLLDNKKKMAEPYKRKYTNGRVRADRLASCGLHVHVSRNSFRSPGHVYRFALLLATPLARKMSRRRSEYWRQRTQAHRYCRELLPEASEVQTWFMNMERMYNDNRYRHVNITNSHTVEARIFQGTTNPNKIVKAVEFTKLALEASKYSSNNTATEGLMIALTKKYYDQYSHIVDDVCNYEGSL